MSAPLPLHLPGMLPDLAQYVNTFLARLISKSLQALGVGNISLPRLIVKSREIARSRGHADQRICEVGAVYAPVFLCLRSSCRHLTEVRGP